jgi:predicted SAM-dependent methyltransferase
MKRLFRKLFNSYRFKKYITKLTKNKTLFVNKSKINKLHYLNIGAGDAVFDGFINVDKFWRPGLDLCWDITEKALPFEKNTLRGIFSEHCLEHIPHRKIGFVLKEFHRVLVKGGVIRVSMPDGESFLNYYQRRKNGEQINMPNEKEFGLHFPIESINRIFGQHGHEFVYDYETFKLHLEKTGFDHIAKKSFQEGIAPELLLDQDFRKVESMYIEGVKK